MKIFGKDKQINLNSYKENSDLNSQVNILKTEPDSILNEYPYLTIKRDSPRSNSFLTSSLARSSANSITYSIKSESDKELIKKNPKVNTSSKQVKYSHQIDESTSTNIQLNPESKQSRVILVQTPVYIQRPPTIMKQVQYMYAPPTQIQRLPAIHNQNAPKTISLIRQPNYQPRQVAYIQPKQQVIVRHVPQQPVHVPAIVVKQTPVIPSSPPIPKMPERKPSPIMLFHNQDSKNDSEFLDSASSINLDNSLPKNKLDFIANLFDGYYYTNIDYTTGAYRSNSGLDSKSRDESVKFEKPALNKNYHQNSYQKALNRNVQQAQRAPSGSNEQVAISYSRLPSYNQNHQQFQRPESSRKFSQFSSNLNYPRNQFYAEYKN